MAQAAQIPQAAGASPVRGTWLSTTLWWIMLLFSALIALYATTYFLRLPRDPHFARYIFPLRLHIAGGIGALLAGPWQFSQRLRARALNFHRWLGRFYLLEVLLGSLAGLYMATVSEEGIGTHLGFGILAILWFYTGLQAYRLIRQGNVEAHRAWMTRNFALTLAAVTLRIELPFMLAALHWPFARSYMIVSWLCWVPNVFVAEWLVRRRV